MLNIRSSKSLIDKRLSKESSEKVDDKNGIDQVLTAGAETGKQARNWEPDHRSIQEAFHHNHSIVNSTLAKDVEAQLLEARDEWGSFLVVPTANPIRQVWSVLIILLLVYTGTIFLYRLAFIDFRIEQDDDDPAANSESGPDGWMHFDKFIGVVFWVDLAVNFFFSYMDSAGQEVRSLRLAVRHYLATAFVIDVLACLPDGAFTWLFASLSGEGGLGQMNQGVKSIRLKRMTRLARLTRLSRLAKLAPFLQGHIFVWMKQQRGFGLFNLGLSLAWVVHMVACGWYICASLHEDSGDTWVSRRLVNSVGESLLTQQPVNQWIQSMYFTLTVFTTVGFGDIYAMTNGEIVYLSLMMMVGATVNSIVVSSVIRLLTANDHAQEFVQKKLTLTEAFARHTELGDQSLRALRSWVTVSAKFWMQHQYDRDEMRELIVGKYMPPVLASRLPFDLFGGKLADNRLFRVGKEIGFATPTRLPLLMALAGQKTTFHKGALVYQVQDFAFSLYLVLGGTFAYVGGVPMFRGYTQNSALDGSKSVRVKPGSTQSATTSDASGQKRIPGLARFGRLSAMPEDREDHDETLFPYQMFGFNAYFGDVEIFQKCPRLATVRCETNGGSLLSITKTDLYNLMEEFPHLGARWRLEARRHRRGCDAANFLSVLKRRMPHEDFAAIAIQRWVRSWPTKWDADRRRQRANISDVLAACGDDETSREYQRLLKAQEKTQKDVAALGSVVGRLSQNLATLSQNVVLLMGAMQVTPVEPVEKKNMLPAIPSATASAPVSSNFTEVGSDRSPMAKRSPGRTPPSVNRSAPRSPEICKHRL